MLMIKNGNELALLVPWIPRSNTCKPAGLQGAVTVTNVIRESGIKEAPHSLALTNTHQFETAHSMKGYTWYCHFWGTRHA